MLPKNDADYPVCKGSAQNRIWCPIFTIWKAMINRCYSDKIQEQSPSYIGCSVVPEWHSFMAFRAWVIGQDWKGKQLDKDLLIPGNKVYGPDTSMFISQRANSILLDTASSRGDHPLGVCWHKKAMKFMASISINGRQKYLGLFSSALDAHRAWQIAKADTIDSVATEESDSRVAAALRRRADALRLDWLNEKETIDHKSQGVRQ